MSVGFCGVWFVEFCGVEKLGCRLGQLRCSIYGLLSYGYVHFQVFTLVSLLESVDRFLSVFAPVFDLVVVYVDTGLNFWMA